LNEEITEKEALQRGGRLGSKEKARSFKKEKHLSPGRKEVLTSASGRGEEGNFLMRKGGKSFIVPKSMRVRKGKRKKKRRPSRLIRIEKKKRGR